MRPRDEKLLNRTFRTFIWQGKRPRVALHILQQHKSHGGIHFPDLRLYNLSTNLRVLQDWFKGTSFYSPTPLAAQRAPMVSLTNLLHLPHSALPAEVKNNPLIMASWRTWVQSRRKRNFSATDSLSLSFVRNLQFQDGRAHSIFQHRGFISPKRDCLMGGTSTSACTRCGENDADLFHYFWDCPSIKEFWCHIHRFATTHTKCQFSFTPSWAITGSLHETEMVIPSQSKRLLFCISAAGRKTILQTWIGPILPSQRLFLEKQTFLLRMDWVEADLQKESRVKKFFQTWTPIINLLPTHIKQRIQTCFQYTAWYLEKNLGNTAPVLST